MNRRTLATAYDIEHRTLDVYRLFLQHSRPVYGHHRHYSPAEYRRRMRQVIGQLPEALDAIETAADQWARRHAERSQTRADRIHARLIGQIKVMRQCLTDAETKPTRATRTGLAAVAVLGPMRGADSSHTVHLPTIDTHLYPMGGMTL